MRIRTKFTIIFLIVSLIPLAIVGVIAYQNGKKTIKENLGESHLQAAHVITERIDRSLYEVYNNLQTWTELDVTQEIIADDVDGKISTFFLELSREYGYFSYINALNIQGEVVASSNLKLIGRNFKFKLENFYKNSNGGKAYVEDAYLDEISNNWVVNFFFPVKAKFDKNKIIGFLFAGWKVDELSSLITSGKREEHYNIRLMVMKGDGLVLYASEFGEEVTYKLNLIDSGLKSALYASKKEKGYVVETDERNKKSVIAYHYSKGYRDFPGLGWAALVVQDVRTAFEPIVHLQIIIFGVGALVGIFVIFVSIYVTRRMTNPILQISQVAGKVADGNFEVEVDHNSSDEIGYLAKTFNQMIGELKTQRSRLKESETRFRTVLETVGEGIITVDFTGTIVMVNQEFQNIFGYQQKELIGKNLGILMTEKYREDSSADMKRFLKNEIPQVAGQQFELEGLKKDGSTFPLEINVKYITKEKKDYKNYKDYMVAAVRDITDRKRAEEESEEELHHKTKLIQLLKEIAVTANEATTVEEAIQICLDKVCDYMNWPVGHVYLIDSMGKLTPSTLWHLENPQRFETFREVTEVTPFEPGVGLPGRVLAHGKPSWITDVTKDTNFPRAKLAKDIGVKAGFALPVLEGKKVVAVLEFFSEKAIEPDESLLEALSNLATQLGRVTERKRVGEALRKSEEQLRQSEKLAAVGVLASGVAHEVGNPLTSIFSLAQVIERKSKEQFTREKISLMKTHVDRISKIIHDFLNFSKPASSNFVCIDVQPTIESTVRLAKYDKRMKKLNITTQIEDSLPKVYGSPDGFHQVFLNLILNAADAVKKMEEGQLTVTASKTNNFINITFCDNGAGMSKEEKVKIFEPFYTTKEPGKGMGLGLFVSYGIIKSFGGEIVVESEKGKGASFNLRFPISNANGIRKNQ